MDNWSTFCDFPEISHIAIQGIKVCISRQDNMSMVNSLVKLYLVSIFVFVLYVAHLHIFDFQDMRLGSSLQARSLVSLLDGYFRLTTDAHHYLCHEVVPPRVVLSETNDLHGPYCTTLASSTIFTIFLFFYILFYYVFTLFLLLEMSLCSKNWRKKQRRERLLCAGVFWITIA